jgi:enoyl-CoA hydratase/carnithine racemase
VAELEAAVRVERRCPKRIVDRVVPVEEFDAAVADWAGRLAAKSPVLMRLGKDALLRQQDMTLEDAWEFLRSQLTIAFSTEDSAGGREGLLREARPTLDGSLTASRALICL